MSNLSTKTDFMPHINGLRALAIILVVLYHLDAALCPCGYFGVDVFLLISGWFIFSKELTAERIPHLKYGSYLYRKVWRLGPPALLTGIITVVVGAFILLSEAHEMSLWTLAATCIGASNEYVAHSGDYFNPNVQYNPLMHYWYIGLIFQIYIILPLIALLIKRMSATYRGIVWGIIGISSLLLSVLLNYGTAWAWSTDIVHRWSQWASPYYSILTRMWEPILALALLQLPQLPRQLVKIRAALGILGATLLVGSCYYYETSSPTVYIALAGAMLLLQYGNCGPIGILLRFTPIQWVGNISFSLYLIHWPIFTLLRYKEFGELSTADMWGAVIASVAASWILWRFIESRCGGWLRALSRQKAAVTSALVLVGTALTSYLFITVPFLSQLLPNAAYTNDTELSYPDASKLVTGNELGAFPYEAFTKKPYIIGDITKHPVSFLMLGDSHAWHLYHGMDKYLTQKGNRCGVWLADSCVPAWNVYYPPKKGQSSWDREKGEKLNEWLLENENIKTIIISVYWNVRFKDSSVRDWDLNSLPIEKRREHIENGLRETCRRLKEGGKKVIVLRDTPFYPYGTNHVEHYKRAALSGATYKLPSQTPEDMAQRSKAEEAFMQSLQKDGLAEVVDLSPALMEDGVYPIQLKNGTILYRDNDHLTEAASELAGDYFFRWWEEKEHE